MFNKCLLCVILAFVVKPVELFHGDDCYGENGGGICKPLSNCPHLANEVRRAGIPMPDYMRRKLHNLACGFEYEHPLICCEPVYSNIDHSATNVYEYTVPHTPDFRPTHQWLGSSEENLGSHAYPQNIEYTRPSIYPQNNDQFKPNTHLQHNQQTRPNINPQNNQQTRPNTNVQNNEQTRPNTNSQNNKPTRPTNDRGSSSGSSDISNHRNFRLLPTNCGPIESDRIYGGDRTRLFEMPWMVLLSYDSARGTKLSCGGSLITEWYVLTAAHCVSFLGAKLKLRAVIIGEYDTRSDPDCERNEGELTCAPSVQTVAIDRVIPHSGYSPQRLVDDIALIKLSQRADFTLENLKPICLPTNARLRDENLDGMQGVVAGWGATEDGLQSPVLLSVQLPILSNSDCSDIYNGSSEIFSTQLCAGGVAGKDSCGGDSGGPLVYPGRPTGAGGGGSGGTRYVQRGIVSYGSKRCGLGGFPGVYTRVTEYMDWILDNLS